MQSDIRGPATVQISRVNGENGDLPLPSYSTPGSAGMDISAALAEDVVIAPRERALIPTGFSIALPPGLEAQVRPRSGLAIKHGITVLNGPGTIDSDYRGEVKIILYNAGDKPFTIRRGDRIAQLIVAAYERIVWEETKQLEPTGRGEGGFGHTGLRSNS